MLKGKRPAAAPCQARAAFSDNFARKRRTVVSSRGEGVSTTTKQLQAKQFEIVLTEVHEGRLEQCLLTSDVGPGTDDRLRQLSREPVVRSIVLETTDEGLKYVSLVPRLRTFAVVGGAVTEKGIEFLQGLNDNWDAGLRQGPTCSSIDAASSNPQL
jgi:hypothetical protein